MKTSIAKKFPKRQGPLLYMYHYLKFYLEPFSMYVLEGNNTSPLCILCTLMPQIIPLLTLMLVHTWYKESASPGVSIEHTYH